MESTKLKAVEDVPLLPLAGPLFEGMEFPTGEVAKKVRHSPLQYGVTSFLYFPQ